MEIRSAAASDLRSGIAVEWLSIAWMAVEAIVSLAAVLATGSVALLAFGADSAIEIVSAAVLLRRLRLEQGGLPLARVAQAERRAAWLTGSLLLLLAVWVVVEAGFSLLRQARPAVSPLGMAIAAAAMLLMPWIAHRKRQVAARIGSAALKADAACGMVCASMAATLLAGLALRAAFGWWWADPVAALGIVYFIGREGLEAIAAGRGRGGGCGCSDA